MAGNYRQVLAGDLPNIHVHYKCTITEMLKFEGVLINGAEIVAVCYHGDQESFGYATHESLVDRE
jgi:hypothetical protein